MQTAPTPLREDARTRPPLPTGRVVRLRGARVTGPLGPVFGPLDADSDRPITVVDGPQGSGRTALLLALAGRLRLDAGELATLDESRLGTIRNRVGIAGFAEIDALEPAVSVGAHLRERLSWATPWYRRTPRMSPELVRALLLPTFGQDRALPDTDRLARDLGPADELLLRIALARVEQPALLCIDDVDALRDPADRERVASRITAIADSGTPIILATSDPADADRFTDPARIRLTPAD